MTIAELQDDRNEAVNHFLKLHEKELEPQVFKLARCYSIDLHELLSRTTLTVWEKWQSEFCALPESERYQHTMHIMSNHARNLSKNARRNESKCNLLPGDELERLTHALHEQEATDLTTKDDDHTGHIALLLTDQSQEGARSDDVQEVGRPLGAASPAPSVSGDRPAPVHGAVIIEQRLTPQELGVALAVLRGLSNADAAANLFLSVKTIEYHLSNIYRKLGISSRTQLISTLSERGYKFSM